MHMLASSGEVLHIHLHAIALYDNQCVPSSVVWILKRLPDELRAGQVLPPETNIGDALREASILSYEQSESKLVEVRDVKWCCVIWSCGMSCVRAGAATQDQRVLCGVAVCYVVWNELPLETNIGDASTLSNIVECE